MTILKPLYGSWQAFTITLASLASDTNLLAGRAGTVFDNTTDLFEDLCISGKFTTGTTPTVDRQIEVWAYTDFGSNSVYPDSITGSDANKTLTSAAIKRSGLVQLAFIQTDGTSNRTYPMRQRSLVQALGGVIPLKVAPFVVHNTGVNLNATAGNHEIMFKGINGQF